MISNFMDEKKNELVLSASGSVYDTSYETYIYYLREARKNPSLNTISDALRDIKTNMART